MPLWGATPLWGAMPRGGLVHWRLLGAWLAFFTAAPTSVARADEPVVVTLDPAAWLPVLPPQVDRFGPGAALGAGVLFAVGDFVCLGLRARGGFFADGPAPADPTLADPGVGDLYTLTLAVRVRPLAALHPGPERAVGAWLEVAGGGGVTGEVARPVVEGALGWLFAVDDVALGPFARWTTVFELENRLDDRPAHILAAGLELAFFDARPAPPAPVVVEPRVPGDRDGDGLRDDVDQCVDQPEDHDAFADDDGCPDLDNDEDQVLDAYDQCPVVPEDADGFEDEDGCPEPDNDLDTIGDADDACPLEPEVVNGIHDEDGCPDQGLVRMVDDRVVLDDRVLFDLNRARLRSEGRAVLEALLALYRQHPEWTRLRIEGHADVRGTLGHNQILSERRAHKVRLAVVRLGIPDEMIDAVGFGETRPRAWGDREEIYQMNRRVEFVVMSRRRIESPAPTPRDPLLAITARLGAEEAAP